MRWIENMPITPRICIQIGVLVAVSFAILGGSLIFAVRRDSTDRICQLARSLARQEAGEVSARLNKAAEVTRGLATGMETMVNSSVASRQLGNELITNTLKKSDGMISVWCVFERNAFDGKDVKYINTKYGNDVGRYATGFDSAEAGKIGFSEPNEAELVPGSGDYYLVPKNNGKDTIVDPYYYVYRPGTPQVFETSFALPVWKKGQIAGIVGADITLDALSEASRKIKPYGKGYAVIVSNNGTYVAHSNPAMLGKDIGKSREMKAIKAAVAAGREYETTVDDKTIGGMARTVVVPIRVGQADAQWAVAVAIPMKEALAPVSGLIVTCVLISAAALLLVLLGVIAVARRIARPIQHLRDVAQYLATGNIERATELMKAS